MIRDVIMRDEGQCAFFKGDYNFPMSPRLHGLRESRCLHFVQKSGVQIAFAFKCACLLTCILVESATCALGQSTAVPELKSLYPSCAENPAVQGGDVERGERSWPKLNSVSAAARCTGG